MRDEVLGHEKATYQHHFRIWCELKNTDGERPNREIINLCIDLAVTESPDAITDEELIQAIAKQIGRRQEDITIISRLERGLQGANESSRKKALLEWEKNNSQ